MKKTLLIAFAFIGLNLCFTSCSSDYDANPETNNSDIRNPLQGSFTAMVNGVQFISDENTVIDTLFNDTRMLAISGLAYSPEKDPQKYQVITLTIPDYTGASAYAIDGSVSGQYIITDSAYVQTFTAYTGDTLSVINITKDDGDYEGNFNFRVIPSGSNPNNDTITIAEGNFSIPK